MQPIRVPAGIPAPVPKGQIWCGYMCGDNASCTLCREYTHTL